MTDCGISFLIEKTLMRIKIKIKNKIEKILKTIYLYGISKQLYDIFFLLKSERGRFLSCFILDLFNIFPDWFIIARFRSFTLNLIGCKVKNPGTSMIRKNFFLEFPRNVSFGENIMINRDVYFCANDKIIIGNNVRISFGVKIINISHTGLGKNIVDNKKPVVIKDDCSIHANAIILPGTVLEDGVHVSAGAIVGGETRRGGVYMGNPARLIKIRDEYL